MRSRRTRTSWPPAPPSWSAALADRLLRVTDVASVAFINRSFAQQPGCCVVNFCVTTLVSHSRRCSSVLSDASRGVGRDSTTFEDVRRCSALLGGRLTDPDPLSDGHRSGRSRVTAAGPRSLGLALVEFRGRRLHVAAAAADSLHASSASESRPSSCFSCHATSSMAVLHRELHSRAGSACCPGAGVACTSQELEPRVTTRVLLDQQLRDDVCAVRAVARRMYLLLRLRFHLNDVNYREITFVSTRERTVRFAAVPVYPGRHPPASPSIKLCRVSAHISGTSTRRGSWRSPLAIREL